MFNHQNTVKANANTDSIKMHFVNVLRNLIRSISSNDPEQSLNAAVREMEFIQELLEATDDEITYKDIYEHAVNVLRSPKNTLDEYDRKYINAALSGISYLCELSCDDNAAKARSAKKLHTFQHQINQTI